MDKFREDFKEDFEFIDWLESLPEDERREFLAKSDVIEGGKDPTVIDIGDEDLDAWVKKYNLHDADEWLEQIRNLTVAPRISSLPKRLGRNIAETKDGNNA